MLTIRKKKKKTERDYTQIKSISLPNITTVRVERQAKNGEVFAFKCNIQKIHKL